MKQYLRHAFYITITISLAISCRKEEFLDKKPNSTLLVPTTLEDFRKLLDNFSKINITGTLAEISSDNYFVSDVQTWQGLPVRERNAYIWAEDLFEGTNNIEDWNACYQQILYANVVLEGLQNVNVTENNKNDYNWIKGWAHFIRGLAFFNLSQQFAKPYDAATSSSDLGIPLRLASDVTATSTRNSIEETYNQILNDLNLASILLPHKEPASDRNRPYKNAAYALLARVYLNMRIYEKALKYADSSLQLYSTLINYNTVDQATSTPFDRLNAETIFQSSLGTTTVLRTTSSLALVDYLLYRSYNENDLRKILFFRIVNGIPTYRKAGYSGATLPFGGIATDELYLIRAEANARVGDVNAAMEDLNTLIANRWANNGSWVPYEANSREEALKIILDERRKELVMRGLRWQDLRRLNKEGYNIMLTRRMNGETYTLHPNSDRYVLPIPPDEIRLSGIQQNPR